MTTFERHENRASDSCIKRMITEGNTVYFAYWARTVDCFDF